MTNFTTYLLIYILCLNLGGFYLCWSDKRRAKKRLRRISEATLLLTGLLGGCFGLALGMYLFRHKTKHIKFLLLVPAQCVLWIYLLYTVLR